MPPPYGHPPPVMNFSVPPPQLAHPQQPPPAVPAYSYYPAMPGYPQPPQGYGYPTAPPSTVYAPTSMPPPPTVVVGVAYTVPPHLSAAPFPPPTSVPSYLSTPSGQFDSKVIDCCTGQVFYLREICIGQKTGFCRLTRRQMNERCKSTISASLYKQ